MSFRLEDFKKTSRKSTEGSGVPALLYPHQMRDKKAMARLEIAIRTFDTLVGKKRGELNAQVMVDFFGDHRIARGVIACLGQYYKYQTLRFAQVIGTEAESRLRAQGLIHPIGIRSHTYLHVNESHHGFLTEENRSRCYEELSAPFGLAAHFWDALLHLDSEDNQVLTRLAKAPFPADIVALYNFHSIDTPLRRATRIQIDQLALTSTDAADIRALARWYGVKAVVSGGTSVTLSDLEMSSLLPRRPGHLSRCLLHLIQSFATRDTVGYADVLLGTRKFRLQLGLDHWKTLGYFPKAISGPTFKRRLTAGDTLHKELLRVRSQGEVVGWRFKRNPDPLVTSCGVLLADFKLTQGAQEIYVLLGATEAKDWDMPVICVPIERSLPKAAQVLALAQGETQNLFAAPDAALPDIPSDVRVLCEKAASEGMVRMAEAQRTLHLLDEGPLIEWMRRGGRSARLLYSRDWFVFERIRRSDQ